MYSDYLHINKNFQTSVNLQLDYNNEKKIREYIPTYDICVVLKTYLKSFLGKEKNYSTLLVGPYGKGKSFLLLVLVYLVSGEPTSSDYQGLLEKFKSLDEELYDLIVEFNNSKQKFLPIILNSNYSDIRQVFSIGMYQALKNIGLAQLVPETAYTKAMAIVNYWKKDKEKNSYFSMCLEKTKLDLTDLENGLEDFDPKSYQDFTLLYRCVAMGIEFNPVISDEVNNLYHSLLKKLKDYGITGIFVVFDEFSSFLNNSSNIIGDLKIIQDFAELANHSTPDQQINFCCVTHKSLNLYHEESKHISEDALKTVEGRFKEIDFNRSLEQNYEIIAGAIIHTRGENELRVEIESYTPFYERVKRLPFIDSYSYKTLFRGCFPLNPISTISLIRLSEKVAQNERTLFTFLADLDEASFNSFLATHDHGLLNVDGIYDYFSEQIAKSDYEERQNVYFRAEASLKQTRDPEEKKTIKTIAVLLAIDDPSELPTSVFMISLGLAKEESETQKILDNLVKNGILSFRSTEKTFTFALASTKAIEDRVELVLKEKIRDKQISEITNDLFPNHYLIPRHYNDDNKITRFFRVLFLSYAQFKALSSFESFYQDSFSDGLVLYIVPTNVTELTHEISKKAIQEKLNAIADPSVIVRLPNSNYSSNFMDNLRRQEARKYILQSELAQSKNKSTHDTEELKLIIEEYARELQEQVDYYYSGNSFFAGYLIRDDDFQATLDHCMENSYPNSIIINNELLNRQSPSAQYQRAEMNVINWILDGANRESFPYSSTSPEQTICFTIVDLFRNAENKNDNLSLLRNELRNVFLEHAGEEIPFSKLADILSSRHNRHIYGLRKGLYPIFLTEAITELNEADVVLKLGEKEIPLNGENLVQAVSSKEDYSFYISPATADERRYFANLMRLLGIEDKGNFRANLALCSEQLRMFFRGLPNIIRSLTPANDFLGISMEILTYKSKFLTEDPNPFDLVVSQPPRIFGSYDNAFHALSDFYQNHKHFLERYQQNLLLQVKNFFGAGDQESLKAASAEWLQKLGGKEGNIVFSSRSSSAIYQSIKEFNYDDNECLRSLCRSTTNLVIEDWSEDNSKKMLERLSDFASDYEKSESVELNKIPDVEELLDKFSGVASPIGETLKNNLESDLKEYGESVSKQERIRILTELLQGELK